MKLDYNGNWLPGIGPVGAWRVVPGPWLIRVFGFPWGPFCFSRREAVTSWILCCFSDFLPQLKRRVHKLKRLI